MNIVYVTQSGTLDMFYDLFATQHIWTDIDQAFSGWKKYSDYQDAFSEISEIRRNAQINYINPSYNILRIF